MQGARRGARTGFVAAAPGRGRIGRPLHKGIVLPNVTHGLAPQRCVDRSVFSTCVTAPLARTARSHSRLIRFRLLVI